MLRSPRARVLQPGRAFVPRWLLAAAVIACSHPLPVARAQAGLPRCTPQPNGTCTCNIACAGQHSAPRKNIILLISDDSTYCHMGFMHGMCLDSSLEPCDTAAVDHSDAGPGVPVHVTNGTCGTSPGHGNVGEVCARGRCFRPCRTNLGCPGADNRCAPSDEVAKRDDVAHKGNRPVANPPLRVADLTCRNRTPNKSRGPFGTIHGFFVFKRAFPAVAEDPTNDAPIYTPYLDALASEGATFPLAHVGGTECKSARTVLWNGIFNRHLFVSGFTGPNPPGSNVNQPCDPSDPARFSGVGCYLHHLGSSQCVGGTGDCTTPPFGDGCACRGDQDCGSASCSQYFVYLWGKGDITNFNVPGNSQVGPPDIDGGLRSGDPQIGNLDSTVCGARCGDLAHGEIVVPGAVVGVENMFAKIDSDLAQDGKTLRKPFMIWYAPKIPHSGKPTPPDFAQLYPASFPPIVGNEYARMSLFDAGIGAVTDALKQRCICDANGQPASLYDNTVLMFVNDNGNNSLTSNSKRKPTEDGERTPIIINEPRLRSSPPGMLPDYAGGVDLLATIVSYAQALPDPYPPSPSLPSPADCGPLRIPLAAGTGTMPVEFGYPYLRNLCRIARSPKPPARALSRAAYFSHWAPAPLDNRKIRMALTAPGKVGVCGPLADKTAYYGHVRPCLTDAQCCETNPHCDHCYFALGSCSCGSRSECVRDSDCLGCGGICQPPASGRGGRCANDPGTACALDADCALDAQGGSLCQGGTCTNAAEGVGEFRGRSCTRSEDCVPHGVCQHVVLKVQVGPGSAGPATPCDDIIAMRDVNLDPDEGENYVTSVAPGIQADPNYVAPSFRNQLRACLRRFWDPCPRQIVDPLSCPQSPPKPAFCPANPSMSDPAWQFCENTCPGQPDDCPFEEPPFGP